METQFLVVGGLILFGIVAVAALFLLKKKEPQETEDGKYPKGHFLSRGIAIGIPLGIPIGLAMGNMPLGLPIGLAIGYAIGTGMEEKNKDKLRPLTPEEEERKKMLARFTLALLFLGALVLAFIYFSTIF